MVILTTMGNAMHQEALQQQLPHWVHLSGTLSICLAGLITISWKSSSLCQPLPLCLCNTVCLHALLKRTLCWVQLEAAVACLADAEVPMKRLLLLVDLARQGITDGQYIPVQRWSQVLTDLSLS